MELNLNLVITLSAVGVVSLVIMLYLVMFYDTNCGEIGKKMVG